MAEKEMPNAPQTEPKTKSHVTGPVVTGKSTDKTSLSQKCQKKFGTSSGEAVGTYLVNNVIKPSVKELLYNIIWKGVREWLYPGSKGVPGDSKSSSSALSQLVSYRKYHDQAQVTAAQVLNSQGVPNENTGFAHSDIIWDDEQDAINLYNAIKELIETYKHCSVAELCELANRPVAATDYNYGWTSMAGFKIIPTPEGKFWFKAPRAFALDLN